MAWRTAVDPDETFTLTGTFEQGLIHLLRSWNVTIVPLVQGHSALNQGTAPT